MTDQTSSGDFGAWECM